VSDPFSQYEVKEFMETSAKKQAESDPFEKYVVQQSADKSEFAPTPSGKQNKIDHTVDRFFYGIAGVETGGTSSPYEALNPESSATGKYQFLWSQWGKKIGEFAGRPVTQQEFLKDPQLQDSFAKHYYYDVLEPEASTLMRQYGPELKKHGVNTLNDTRALIHFQGYNGAAQWAKTGNVIAGADINKNVGSYLNKVKQHQKKFDENLKYRVFVSGGTYDVPGGSMDSLLKDYPNATIVQRL